MFYFPFRVNVFLMIMQKNQPIYTTNLQHDFYLSLNFTLLPLNMSYSHIATQVTAFIDSAILLLLFLYKTLHTCTFSHIHSFKVFQQVQDLDNSRTKKLSSHPFIHSLIKEHYNISNYLLIAIWQLILEQGKENILQNKVIKGNTLKNYKTNNKPTRTLWDTQFLSNSLKNPSITSINSTYIIPHACTPCIDPP